MLKNILNDHFVSWSFHVPCGQNVRSDVSLCVVGFGNLAEQTSVSQGFSVSKNLSNVDLKKPDLPGPKGSLYSIYIYIEDVLPPIEVTRLTWTMISSHFQQNQGLKRAAEDRSLLWKIDTSPFAWRNPWEDRADGDSAICSFGICKVQVNLLQYLPPFHSWIASVNHKHVSTSA